MSYLINDKPILPLKLSPKDTEGAALPMQIILANTSDKNIKNKTVI